MTSKRGQVAVFIIASIILLVLFGFMFYVRASHGEKPFDSSENFDAKSVTSFVNLCLQQKGEEALIAVAGKGGYFALPAYSTERLSDNLPYFFYQGSVFIPTIEKIQENIARAVEKQLGSCLDFISFEGVDISVESRPEIAVVFGSEEMRVTVHQKIVVQNEQSETTLESFTGTIPTVFLAMYEHAKKIVEIHKSSGEYVCLSCFRKLNANADFTIKTGITPEGFLYALEEDKKENNKNIIFRFAVEP